MDIEEPIEIENEMNFTRAIEILNKLKSKVTLVKADKKEYRLPFLMDIEKQAIETVLSELEKKDEVLNEMAKYVEFEKMDFNCSPMCIHEGCIEECIKEYFTNKVEREGK